MLVRSCSILLHFLMDSPDLQRIAAVTLRTLEAQFSVFKEALRDI